VKKLTTLVINLARNDESAVIAANPVELSTPPNDTKTFLFAACANLTRAVSGIPAVADIVPSALGHAKVWII